MRGLEPFEAAAEDGGMRLDHVAHPCRDPSATHGFYTGVLGLELTHVFVGEELLMAFELPGGGSLVFSARLGEAGQAENVDWERQHVGLTVASRAELDRWIERLRAHGVSFRRVDEERVYLADPDGLVVEIEIAAPAPRDPEAERKLQDWLRRS